MNEKKETKLNKSTFFEKVQLKKRNQSIKANKQIKCIIKCNRKKRDKWQKKNFNKKQRNEK